MGLYVAEYANSIGGRYRQPGTPQGPKASYTLTPGGTFSATPQAGTQFIRVSADSSSPAILLSLSLSSTVALTSTNAVRIPPNAAPEFFAVSTANLIQVAASPT